MTKREFKTFVLDVLEFAMLSNAMGRDLEQLIADIRFDTVCCTKDFYKSKDKIVRNLYMNLQDKYDVDEKEKERYFDYDSKEWKVVTDEF